MASSTELVWTRQDTDKAESENMMSGFTVYRKVVLQARPYASLLTHQDGEALLHGLPGGRSGRQHGQLLLQGRVHLQVQ